MKCRFCFEPVSLPFVDLVNAPPSNSFLTTELLNEPEVYYPLSVYVCEKCWLVQVDEYKKSNEIFDQDYAYFSSFSTSWLAHSKAYVEMVTKRLKLDHNSFVVEVASNDGYLLQNFVTMDISCLGVEPTAGTAAAAREKGVVTEEFFWGVDTAKKFIKEHGQCDLMLGNNVLAHVPDINDFVEGFTLALKSSGTLTFEFPHLLNLINFNQFDTIYHEHFSYLSLTAVRKIFAAHKLTIYDVEEVTTHGGSLRIFLRHDEYTDLTVQSSVDKLEKRENDAGLRESSGYLGIQKNTDHIRMQALDFLNKQKREGLKVIAYGAAAKGSTFLNYCGIKGTDLIEYVVDGSHHKQGMYMPGSHIPIVSEERICESKPDFVIILPWNLREEIETQLSYISEWGGRFVTFIPELKISNSSK
jgi:hypothetical protein